MPGIKTLPYCAIVPCMGGVINQKSVTRARQGSGSLINFQTAPWDVTGEFVSLFFEES
jgi:hypothetical protein